MNPLHRLARLLLCGLLLGLGLSIQSAHAAYTCTMEQLGESSWATITAIDKSLPLGTTLFQRLITVRLTLKKTTTTVEKFKIVGNWSQPGQLLPAPISALQATGTATGGGILKGYGMRLKLLTGELFKSESLVLMDSTFTAKEMTTNIYFFQEIVNTDNSTLQGGVLNIADDSAFSIYTPTLTCQTAWLFSNLQVTIPAPINSTCTLDTKLKDIAWPALASRDMTLNGISHKRNLDIVLSKCGKGVKPNIHFASYRDLARGQLKNPVASKKDNSIIQGLAIRAKNASTGADIRFGDPNATTGDSTASFNIGTAANENATLTQKIDFYLERTTDKLPEGEWISNMSFIISYP